MSDQKSLEQTRKLMQALAQMPPKPHEKMKVGKPKADTLKRAKKRASAKSKTA